MWLPQVTFGDDTERMWQAEHKHPLHLLHPLAPHLFLVELVAHVAQLQSLQSEKVQSSQFRYHAEEVMVPYQANLGNPIEMGLWFQDDFNCRFLWGKQSSGQGVTIEQFCCSAASARSHTWDLRSNPSLHLYTAKVENVCKEV